MDFDNFNNIEELLNYMGYEKINNEDNKCDSDKNCNKKNHANNCNFNEDEKEYLKWCSKLNLDIPDGFQHITPMSFVILGEVIGDIMSGELPYNVANFVSNFIILIGQIIETYGTQQMYYEIGPGRYFNCLNKNIENPNCNFEKNAGDNVNKFNVGNDKVNSKLNNLNKYEDNAILYINELNLKISNLEMKFNEALNKINELEKKLENYKI